MGFPSFLFPAFFVIVLFAAAFPAVITAVYLQVYKRHINRALRAEGPHAAMAPPYQIVIILTIVVLFTGVIVSLFTGYKLAYDYFEKDVPEFSAFDLQAFYAEVRETGEHSITVQGLAINEERYRGEFQYEVWGETSIVEDDEPLPLSELARGDLVSVILITGGGATADLFKIQRIASDSQLSVY